MDAEEGTWHYEPSVYYRKTSIPQSNSYSSIRYNWPLKISFGMLKRDQMKPSEWLFIGEQETSNFIHPL